MNLFSNKFLRIIFTAVIFTVSLMFNNTALAENDGGILTVKVWKSSSSSWISFNSQALFSEANFLPGQDITRHIRVTNETADDQKIGVKFIDTSGIQCDENYLSDELYISIGKEGGTLTSFYENGETYLSDIGAEQSIEYDLSVKFISGAGNSYQESIVNFNVEIGFFGEESIEAEIPSGGSEGTIITAGVEISNENVSSIEEAQVTITWLTNYNSTSRVIYSPQGFSHLFDLNNPPNYGYAYSSVEKDNVFPISVNGAINHSVILYGLSTGTTYYYRAISHASPPSITEERSFATLDSSSSNSKKSSGKSSHKHYRKNKKLAGNVLASSPNPSSSESGETNNETSAATFSESEGMESAEMENGEVAGEHGRDCKGQSWWIWALALIAYTILFNFNNFYGEQKREKIRWFWEILYIIAALSLWNMFDQCHINIWFPCLIIIIGLLSYGYYLWGMKKASQ